jgi:hypothetical protein
MVRYSQTRSLNNRVYQINTLQDLRLYLKYTTVQFEIRDENQAIFAGKILSFITGLVFCTQSQY